jgi:hypothetical protein
MVILSLSLSLSLSPGNARRCLTIGHVLHSSKAQAFILAFLYCKFVSRALVIYFVAT